MSCYTISEEERSSVLLLLKGVSQVIWNAISIAVLLKERRMIVCKDLNQVERFEF